jgi:hypothetical protein
MLKVKSGNVSIYLLVWHAVYSLPSIFLLVYHLEASHEISSSMPLYTKFISIMATIYVYELTFSKNRVLYFMMYI